MARLEIYTDGACKGNPGPGGHGVVALFNGKYIFQEYSHYSNDTTNNREELKAILYALKECLENLQYLKIIGGAVIYCDSAYAVNACNDWIWDWADDDWKNSKGEVVKNLDIVKELYQAMRDIRKVSGFLPLVEIKKVSGHRGIGGNELADALATNDKAKRNYICQKHRYKSIDFLIKKINTDEIVY